MHTKLCEEVAQRMIAKIHSGELRAGDRLPAERTLAEEYGVSRTVIREALRSMEMMGCVETRVGEGTHIKAPDLSDIIDPFAMMVQNNIKTGSELIEVRLILETEVAALAARRRTESQLREMEYSLQQMQEDIENGGMGIDADIRFHEILAEAAGNEALKTILSMCSDMLNRTRPITQSVKGVPKVTLSDHRGIWEAVRQQDERGAKRLMRNHLNRAQRNLLKGQKKEQSV